MTSPTTSSLLRPSPMDLGAVVAGTFEVFKRRFGLFVLLAAAPVGIFLAIGAALLAISTTVRNSLTSGWDTETQVFIGLLATFIVLTVVSLMAQLKFAGMTTAAVLELTEGRKPTFHSLWEQTHGVTTRLVGFIGIIVGAVIAVFLLLAVSLLLLERAADGGQDAATVLLFLLVVGMFPALAVAGMYFGTRWLYALPAAAVERATGLGVIRRSWALTRGSFWRTFGYVLISTLIVNAISMVASIPMQVGMLDLATALGSAAGTSTPADVVGVFSGLPFTVTLAVLLSFLVQLLTVPFQLIYQTVMYLDQVRRHQLAAIPHEPTFVPQTTGPLWSHGGWADTPPTQAPASQPNAAQPPTIQPPTTQPPTTPPPAPQPWPNTPPQP